MKMLCCNSRKKGIDDEIEKDMDDEFEENKLEEVMKMRKEADEAGYDDNYDFMPKKKDNKDEDEENEGKEVENKEDEKENEKNTGSKCIVF